jgi:uncharacterized protein YrzB (UPF0473 family)
MDTETMVVIDENGDEQVYEIVLTFESQEYQKHYVIYKLPGDDNDEVFASSYNPESNDGGDLAPITDDEEWDMIEEVLYTFTEDEEEL